MPRALVPGPYPETGLERVFTGCSHSGKRRVISAPETEAMTTYRLRIERPSASVEAADVATAIDVAGGELISVDLREIDYASVVEDVVAEFPGGLHPGSLSAQLEARPRATLLSSRSCDCRDTVSRRGAGEHRGASSQALHDRVRAACPMSNAWVGPVADATSSPAARMALERSGPVAHLGVDNGGPLRADGRRSGWVLAVPDRYPDAEIVALLGRPASLRFSAEETGRIEAIISTRRS